MFEMEDNLFDFDKGAKYLGVEIDKKWGNHYDSRKVVTKEYNK
jgi:hypothetical protein